MRLQPWFLLVITLIFSTQSVWEKTPAQALQHPSNSTASTTLPIINWQQQVIDARGYAGQFSDLVLDSNGHPHVAYWRSEGMTSILFYMRWDGVTWQKEKVDRDIVVGNIVSIMLDAQQRPHIAYQDSVNQDLYYTFRDENGWQKTLLQDQGVVGRFNNIVLSNLGVAITYLDETNGEINILFAEVGSLTFTAPQRVALTTTLGRHGLAVNSQGFPRVSYHDPLTGALMLASQDNTGHWSSETVGNFGTVGVTSSLAYDSDDVPHITGSVFYDDRYFLNHYTYNGGSWLDEGIDGDVNASLGRLHDLTLDSSGRPVVAYVNDTSQQLMLARRESAYNWQIEPINQINVLRVGGIGVDASGNPIVSYYEGDFGDLLVSSGGDDWQTRIVYDNNAQPNHRPSLALNGHTPAVTFHTEATAPDSLQYVPWDGSAWADDIVSANADRAIASPLVYTADGQAHAAYYQASTQQIMFATLSNNIWSALPAVTLSPGASIGQELQLMLVGQTEDPILVFSRYDSTNGAELVMAQGFDGGWEQSALPIPDQSAPLSPLAADYYYGGSIGIAYFNPADNTINKALFDGQWQNAVVATGVQATAVDITVSRRRLSNGDPFNTPTITYYDSNANQIVYQRQEDGTAWVAHVVNTPSTSVESLATIFIGNATARPRIAAITTDNAVRLFGADGETFSWFEESVVAEGAAVRSHVNLEFGDRERLTYLEDGVVMHAFRTATTQAPVSPSEPNNGVIGLQKSLCFCFIALSSDYCGGRRLQLRQIAQSVGEQWMQSKAPATNANNDGAVLDALTQLFLATPEGTAFVDSYFIHDNELAHILINDPQLGWDAFRTLENLMPGLTALSQGQGGSAMIDQAMMDQALDIWQRVEAQASPSLAAEINGRLSASNNLQDYVGMSFDGWVISLGVNPPTPSNLTDTIYLPIISSTP